MEGLSRLRLDVVVAALGHFFEYYGLLAAIGAFVIRRVARFPPRLHWADPPLLAMLAAALAGGIVLLLLLHTWVIAIRVGAELLAVVFCARGMRFVAPPLVLAAALLALSGHSAAVQPAAAGAELNDVVHVVSAGMWAGGVLALASVRPPEGWRSAEARTLLERFGRVAVIAFVVTALTGVLSATEHLTAASDLLSTNYGLWLSVKIVLVGCMLGLSLLWRVRGGAGRLEAVAAGLVVLATAALAVLNPPA